MNLINANKSPEEISILDKKLPNFSRTINTIHNTCALGLYCYLASQPPHWKICRMHLRNHFNCGKLHLDRCFKYLQEIGLLEVTTTRDARGRVTGNITVLKGVY